jgi:hypothetical protein
MNEKLAGRQNDQDASGRRPSAPGVISELELYTLEEVKRRLRWTDSALRAAKRRGLILLPCGKRRYVTGREIIRFLLADAVVD